MKILSDDVINNALLNGLLSAIKDDLRERLWACANEVVEDVVQSTADRLVAKVTEHYLRFDTNDRKITLEVLIRHEADHERNDQQ